MNPTIGKKLQSLRKQTRMSQQELAQKLNLSRQTIGKWESDMGLPDIESLVKLSELFHVSINELIGIEENDNERIPVTYEQIQAVLTNLQKENKMRNIYQMIMMLICVISLGLMISMKSDLTNQALETYSDIENHSQNMLYNNRHGYTTQLDLFYGSGSTTYANILEYDFNKETVTFEYQLALKEVDENTQIFMHLTGDFEELKLPFTRNGNLFYLKSTIPLALYDPITLIIQNGSQTKIEDITYHPESTFMRNIGKNFIKLSIPVDEQGNLQLNKLQYTPQNEFPFDMIGDPTGTVTVNLYDKNLNPIYHEIYFPLTTQKTVELDRKLPLNEKIYIELSFDLKTENAHTSFSFNSYSQDVNEYFVIEDTTTEYIICN